MTAIERIHDNVSELTDSPRPEERLWEVGSPFKTLGIALTLVSSTEVEEWDSGHSFIRIMRAAADNDKETLDRAMSSLRNALAIHDPEASVSEFVSSRELARWLLGYGARNAILVALGERGDDVIIYESERLTPRHRLRELFLR